MTYYKSFLILSAIAVAMACTPPNGATRGDKPAVVQVELNDGEQITYTGAISTASPVGWQATVKVVATNNSADICGTAPGANMRETSPQVGEGVIVCELRDFVIPITITPYPTNSGTAEGVVYTAAGDAVGAWSIVWGD